jgi:hypothetical protein
MITLEGMSNSLTKLDMTRQCNTRLMQHPKYSAGYSSRTGLLRFRLAAVPGSVARDHTDNCLGSRVLYRRTPSAGTTSCS